MPDISGAPNSMCARGTPWTLWDRELPALVAGPTKSPARRDGAWKVGGSNYESFSGFNLTWLMAFVGSEALRLTRVAELAA